MERFTPATAQQMLQQHLEKHASVPGATVVLDIDDTVLRTEGRTDTQRSNHIPTELMRFVANLQPCFCSACTRLTSACVEPGKGLAIASISSLHCSLQQGTRGHAFRTPEVRHRQLESDAESCCDVESRG